MNQAFANKNEGEHSVVYVPGREGSGEEGKLVAVAPRSAMWDRMLAARGSVGGGGGGGGEVDVRANPPAHLCCSLCDQLFEDASLVTCCSADFCAGCIREALVERGASATCCYSLLLAATRRYSLLLAAH